MSYIVKTTKASWAAAVALLLVGCQHVPRAIQLYQPPPPQNPLGTITDPIWQSQERSAEASDFVIYQHEFEYNTANFNTAGKDHVTEIAFRLQKGRPFPVVVEQSRTSVKEGTEYEYPVHVNPKLDMERRERVAKALELMGVADAEQLVVVAPAYAPGMLATEAVGAYQQGFIGIGGYPGQPGFGGYGGFGGFRSGGFGAFGGFGGFGRFGF